MTAGSASYVSVLSSTKVLEFTKDPLYLKLMTELEIGVYWQTNLSHSLACCFKAVP